MIRAVLDTSVLVSAAISPTGSPASCIRAHADGRFELIVSPALLHELRTTLADDRLTRFIIEARRELVTSAAERYGVSVPDPPNPPQLCRDADDDYLLALVQAGEADVLVTVDKDLLAVEAADIRVVTPRTFLALLTSRP